ncbi:MULTISPECIES: class I SAM-dependent methyltransferase [Nocardioides]|uniref:Class I SAM-dependent methyltransferase n=1 Tax=Nocardioides vastitatis TaxID=2568655 RepID=A0ABW0ZLX1_9ACTN|nr:SAM-dependent methyltransferase [Nocardioides sp.]THI97257.1 SAM-dependent methyltransferase [Nocardioides sp.]
MSSTTEPLDRGLARVREDLLADDRLIRAVGSGRQRSTTPPWRRVELRWVDLKAGRHLQVVAYDATQAHTSNHLRGEAADAAVDALLAEPFGNWTVETTDRRLTLRVTKKGDAATHTSAAAAGSGQAGEPDRSHDRAKERLLQEDDPVFAALGLADARGRIKPSRMAKYRQVEDFLRILDRSIDEAMEKGHVRTPTADDPLRIVDLGCGNGYLTFAAHRFLGGRRGLPVRLTGVDVKAQSAEHNATVARDLGIEADFVVGTIGEASLAEPPDVVLALHACDTATDEALARAVEWAAPLVLAAPCCHHDIAAQLRRTPTPSPYSSLTRHGILRERFADTLTDALRALLLRTQGYRVEVMEFVESRHTPRNTLLRAVRTGDGGSASTVQEYDDLVATWGIRPKLGELLAADAGSGTGAGE